MKKIISIVLAFALMLPSLTVFAVNDDEVINALFNARYLSGELDFKMEIHPNAPLPAFIDPDGSQTKMLETVNFTYHMKYHVSEDAKKMQSEIDMIASVPNMDDTAIKYWIDMDLSDAEKPIYKIIMQPSNNDKYLYMDYANNPVIPLSEIMPAYIDNIDVLNEELLKSVDVSKLKPEFKEGKYIIVLDEITIKNILKTTATGMSEFFMKYFMALTNSMPSEASSAGIIGGADGPTAIFITDQPTQVADGEEPNNEAVKAIYEKAVIEFFEKLDTVQLFDKNAIVIESELDDKNLIKNQKIVIHINANIAELMELFTHANAGITKENSNLDISVVMDFAYSKINDPIDITFPELTKDNAIDLFGSLIRQPVIDQSKINVIINGQIINFDVEPVMQEGHVLVPIRAFLNAMGIKDQDITYQDGNISINSGDTVVNLTVGSNIALVNGKEVALDVPAQVIADRTLLPIRFIAETFHSDVDWTPIYKDKEGTFSGGIVHITAKRESSKVSLMIPSDSQVIDIASMEKASRMTGIQADIISVPAEHYKDKMMIMVAAGEPAVMMGNEGVEKEMITRLIDMGAFVPQKNYIEQYAPNIHILLDTNPEIKKAITHEDGEIYSLPIIKKDSVTYDEFFVTSTVKNPENAVILLSCYTALLSQEETITIVNK